MHTTPSSYALFAYELGVVESMKKKKEALSMVGLGELEAMHTGSLLTRLQRLRECEESYECTDLTVEEIEDRKSSGQIHVKESEVWREAFAQVKSVLATRKHLPRPEEKKKEKNAK